MIHTLALLLAPAVLAGSPAKFDDGAKSFDEARKMLLERYVDDGLTEEELWRYAVEGMLAKAGGREWDALLSPEELAEMKPGIGGELVGIGVEIRFDVESGLGFVKRVLPGSAAEKAGLAAQDAILEVDGKSYRGKEYRELVAAIRGKEATAVELTLLRGDRVIAKSIRRQKITVETVTETALADGVSQLAISSFTEKTPAAVKAAIEKARARGAKAWVVDLRGCPGGLFDQVLETANLLLPEGAAVVNITRRGGAKETLTAKGGAVLPADARVAVLVDEKTSSGGEILAAALRDGRSAKVVGKKTFGKWNVQTLEHLPNGWTMKFTVGLFETPRGEKLDGEGLLPDLEAAGAEGALRTAITTLQLAR